MFTGLVQGVGRVASIERVAGEGSDVRLRVAPGAANEIAMLEVGASVSVAGACLTVVAATDGEACFDVSHETLAQTTLGGLAPGDRVNLESAVTPRTLLGGHLVTGHVDGLATVLARTPDDRSVRFELEVPAPLARYLAPKGAICLDGASLTVNEVEGARFSVNIVPHTIAVTTLDEWRPGRTVNVEVDLVARYLARLLDARDGP